MQYLEEQTGLMIARLSNSRRFATGATILIAGLVIQLGTLV